MKRPGLIIFDCDGVLVDSEPIVQQVLADWLTEHGWPMTPERCAREIKGSHIADIQKRAEERAGRSFPGFIEGYRARMFEAFGTGVPEIPGAGDAVRHVRDAGLAYCIASNGPHVKMEATLRSAGLADLFANVSSPVIFSADDVGEPKPSPKLFLHAAERMGSAPADCLVIDDSPQGILAALDAGMMIVGYEDMTPASKLREAGAEIVMSSMNELAGLLKLAASKP